MNRQRETFPVPIPARLLGILQKGGLRFHIPVYREHIRGPEPYWFGVGFLTETIYQVVSTWKGESLEGRAVSLAELTRRNLYEFKVLGNFLNSTLFSWHLELQYFSSYDLESHKYLLEFFTSFTEQEFLYSVNTRLQYGQGQKLELACPV